MTEVIAELERCLSGGSATVLYERSGSSATNITASGASGSGNELQDFLRQISGEEPAKATSDKPSGTVVSPSSAEAETMISSADGAGTDQRTEQTLTLERSGKPKLRVKWLVGSIAAAVVVLLVVVFAVSGKSGTLILEINDGEIAVTLGDTGRTVKGKAKHTLQVPIGELVLHVQREEIAFDTNPFEVTKGENVPIKVERVGRRVRAMQGKTLLGHKESPTGRLSSESNSATANDYALRFDDGHTIRVESLKFDSKKSLTIEASIKIEEQSDKDIDVLALGGHRLFCQRGQNLVLMVDGQPNKSGKVNSAKSWIGQRIHVAYVRLGVQCQLYVDGKLIASGSGRAGSTDTSRGLTLGGAGPVVLDEVRISASSRYTGPKGEALEFTPPSRLEADADTLALYHFDEGQGDKLVDSSGNNHHGKIFGAKWVKADGSPITPSDPDRAAAEWVISKGGNVLLAGQIGNVVIAKVADLPKLPFAVAKVRIHNVPDFSETDAQRLTRLRELTGVSFFGTTLSSGAIRTLAGCRRLEVLFVHDGATTDATLSETLQIPQLRHIDFYNVAVTDEFCARLGQLPQLQSVWLGSCKLISEEGLVRMAAAPPPKLQTFGLSFTKVGVPGLKAISRLPHLQELNLSLTQLDDAGLVELAHCPSLARVVLIDTPVTQTRTTELQKSLAGCQIWVSKPEQAPPLYGPAYRDTIRRLMPRGYDFMVTTNTARGMSWIRGDDPFPKGEVVFAESERTGDAARPVDVELADLQLLTQLSDLRMLHFVKFPSNGLRELLPLKNLTNLSIYSPLTDADIALLPSFPKLSVLFVHVPNDAALETVAKLPHLSSLQFSLGSKITDKGLKALESAPVLSNVNLSYVMSTISPAAVQALANARPDVIVTGAGGERFDPLPLKNVAPPPAKAPFDAQQARAHQEAWAKHLGTKVETPNSVGQTMILIPPGEFLLGSSDEQAAALGGNAMERERPQHRVVISRPFLMGKTEVTIGQFKKFTATGYRTEAEKANPPEKTYLNPGFAISDDLPASFMTWPDAVAFCEWLGTQEKTKYRLPTEAEWEYACRAGTTTMYSFGDNEADFGKYGWYIKNIDGKPHPAGTKLPNAFALHDMHGSRFEWCRDFWGVKSYETSSVVDPTGPLSGGERVLRSGADHQDAPRGRSAHRERQPQGYRNEDFGFRVVRELDLPAAALDGVWLGQEVLAGGVPFAKAKAEARRLVINGNRYTLAIEGKEIAGAFQHDSTASPQTLRFIPQTGGAAAVANQPQLGIYQLDGDTLTFCVGVPNGPRPATFDSTPQGWTLQTYRRDPSSNTPSLAPPMDPDRRFAEHVLKTAGNQLNAVIPGKPGHVTVTKVADLPKEPFQVIQFQALSHDSELIEQLLPLERLQQIAISSRYGLSDSALQQLLTARSARNWLTFSIVSDTMTDDDLLAFVQTCSNLNYLSLQRCPLVTDVGFSHLRQLTKLNDLRLEGSPITDKALESLRQNSLTTLHLVNCPSVTDGGLKHVGEFPQLTGLTLESASITDRGIEQLRTLAKLVDLQLRTPACTDRCLDAVATMTSLSSFSVAGVPITDTGLAKLHGLTALTRLDLTKTQVTAAGVAKFNAAVPKCVVTSDVASGSAGKVTTLDEKP